MKTTGSLMGLAIALLSMVVACSDSNDKNATHDSAQSPEDVGGAAKDAGETSQDIPLFSEDTVDSVGAPPNPCGTYSEDFTRCEANPLYTAGNALSDGRLELFIADPSVLYDEEEQIWKAWWQSPLESDYLNANPKTAILYAESPDGVHWSVQDSPAMTTGADPDDWDFDRAETPSVLKVPSNPPDRRYVMYYTGGNFKAVASPFPGYPWYQIGVAFSADGKTFERLPAAESPYANSRTPFGRIDGLVWYGSDAFPDKATMHDGLVADPSVLIVDGVYHLFASSFAVTKPTRPSPSAFLTQPLPTGSTGSQDQITRLWADSSPQCSGTDPDLRSSIMATATQRGLRCPVPSTPSHISLMPTPPMEPPERPSRLRIPGASSPGTTA